MVGRHQAGLGGAKEVFSLLVLELWHRCFLSVPGSPERSGRVGQLMRGAAEARVR